MIPQRNISLLSNRLASEGGRRIPEAVLERDYCLVWFLAGFSDSSLSRRLVFKGGTALKRCYFGDYRFSEDLDFTLAEETPLQTILAGLEEVYAKVQQASGVVIRYSREDRRQHENSHTFYLAYEGPLPSGSTKEVKVDITISEQIVLPLQERPVLKGYDEYSDLPEDSTVLVYALDEILVEKVVALTDRARNEPRDLYDVWYLTAKQGLDLSMLTQEMASKLAFRGRALSDLGDELASKEGRLKKLWRARLGSQMATLPHFTKVYRSVRRSLRTAGLMNL